MCCYFCCRKMLCSQQVFFTYLYLFIVTCTPVELHNFAHLAKSLHALWKISIFSCLVCGPHTHTSFFSCLLSEKLIFHQYRNAKLLSQYFVVRILYGIFYIIGMWDYRPHNSIVYPITTLSSLFLFSTLLQTVYIENYTRF